MTTTVEMFIGITLGFYGGVLWPISIYVITTRQFYKEEEKEKE